MESRIKWWTFIEILATVTLIIGVVLTSWNIYPANIYMSVVGNFFWLLMGWHWRKWSLVVIETFIILIYAGGAINYFSNGTIDFFLK